jgi:hypothetical protein
LGERKLFHPRKPGRTKKAFRRLRLRKGLLCLALSFFYFFSNVAAVHAAEANFWSERREAARQKKEKPSLADAVPALSLLNEERGRAGLTREQYQLLAQLPGATNFDLGVTEDVPVTNRYVPPVSPSPDISAPSAGKPLPESASPNHQPLRDAPSWLSSLVLPFGSIRDLFLSRSPNAPLIIHIQDAHGIEEAQKNVAAMIEGLREERAPKGLSPSVLTAPFPTRTSPGISPTTF